MVFGFKDILQLDFRLHSAICFTCKCQNILLPHQQFSDLLVLIFKIMLTVKEANHRSPFKVVLCLQVSNILLGPCYFGKGTRMLGN